VLEVVDDALAVEKVHGGTEEVPVQRLGEAQAARLAGHIGDCDDLLERYDLDSGDDDDDVDVAGAQDPEEAKNHHEGPYGACYEVCLLLLVLGGWWLLGSLGHVSELLWWCRKEGAPAYRGGHGTVLGWARGV
jgi:hypothetical protein